jgi:LPXTG-site transpeptidase (sortase) family protein
MEGQMRLEPTKQRWVSTLAIIAGATILLLLGLQYSSRELHRWLTRQDRYLVSDRIAGFDIPSITPTLIPTSTPTPEPEPMPAVRIIIPKIGVNEKIVEIGLKKIGSDEDTRYVWDTAKYAVGHRGNSAHPDQRGNIVLSGHNNVFGQVFRDLDRLEPGDKIYLYTLDKEFVYIVENKELVLAVGATDEDKAKHARYTARTLDETLTLASCWPYATYTHRIYIVAKPQQ